MTIVNIILLNVLWFACVLGAANNLLWPGFLALSVLLVINIYNRSLKRIDLKIVLFSLMAGLIIDGLLHAQGMIRYEHKILDSAFLPPIWILILWVGFGATVRTGMQWLLAQPKLGAVIMLIGAPLSYFSAEKLGAANITMFWQAMSFIGVSWLLYFGLVIYLIKDYKGHADAVA